MSRAAQATAEPATEPTPALTFEQQVDQLRQRFHAETDPIIRQAIGERLMPLETELARAAQRKAQYQHYLDQERRKHEFEQKRLAAWRELPAFVRALCCAPDAIAAETRAGRERPGAVEMTFAGAARIQAKAIVAALANPDEIPDPPKMFMPNPFNNT